MAQKERRGMSAVETAELWKRFKAGESFTAIGRALGRHVASDLRERRARRSATSRTASALNSAVNSRRSRRSAFLCDLMCHLRPELRASKASTKSGQLQVQMRLRVTHSASTRSPRSKPGGTQPNDTPSPTQKRTAYCSALDPTPRAASLQGRTTSSLLSLRRRALSPGRAAGGSILVRPQTQ